MSEVAGGESEQPSFGEAASVAPAPFVVAAAGTKDLVPVRISLAIIERFSEGLYSSPNKTFEELVSNSYDAGAERVWVYMPPDLAAPQSSILVIDDGESMDVQGLHDLWRIGKSNKRDATTGRRRDPIGKFGIGKLATYVLAKELTYIVYKDGVYRAVTMDYQKVRGEMNDPHTLNLQVAELTRSEAQEALLSNLRDYGPRMRPLMLALFPDSGNPPEHWTAAIMTNLKKSAQGIQQGRLKWVLSTAIPLNPSFSLFYNGDPISASKAQGDEIWRFTVGESEKDELRPEDRTGTSLEIEVDGARQPAYKLPLAGVIWGQAQLFKDSLQKGQSERLGRSHGFFVRVRNRLINLDDPTFSVGPELRHGTLTRFNMVINADDLDKLVASPRESLQESPEVRELQAYMLAVFNRSRAAQQTLDDQDRIPLLTEKGRISNPPPGLTQGPLRRMLRRASQGDQAVRDTLGIKVDDSVIPDAIGESESEVLEQVLVEPLSEDARLITYDPQRRAAILNQKHPFVSNYIDNRGTQEALQLLGLTELLTQAYMLDENIDAETVRRVMARRDAFLRDLVSYHPRSAPVVANNLRNASNDEKSLEDAVADALNIMGYHVQRIGGKGTPDGIATVRLGRRGGISSESYALTYDAKSSGKDAKKLLDPDTSRAPGKAPRIQAGTARTSVLRVHRERAAEQFSLEVAPTYTLLVAPGFQGDGDESALIGEVCKNDGITPITVEDLARLVELYPLRRLTPLQLRRLFESHSPEKSRAYVESVEAQSPPSAPPVAEVIDLLVQYSERRTPVTIDTIVTALYERRHLDLTHEEVVAIVRGLAAIAPATMYFDGQLVAMNATPNGLLGELNQTFSEYPSRLADAYRSVFPVSVPKQRVDES